MASSPAPPAAVRLSCGTEEGRVTLLQRPSAPGGRVQAATEKPFRERTALPGSLPGAWLSQGPILRRRPRSDASTLGSPPPSCPGDTRPAPRPSPYTTPADDEGGWAPAARPPRAAFQRASGIWGPAGALPARDRGPPARAHHSSSAGACSRATGPGAQAPPGGPHPPRSRAQSWAAEAVAALTGAQPLAGLLVLLLLLPPGQLLHLGGGGRGAQVRRGPLWLGPRGRAEGLVSSRHCPGSPARSSTGQAFAAAVGGQRWAATVSRGNRGFLSGGQVRCL